jgi:hypothetical protein
MSTLSFLFCLGIDRLKLCRVLDGKEVEKMSDHNPIVAAFE